MAGKDAGLRIRVERGLRDEFLDVCRAQDRPAAQVIREFMRRYVTEHEPAQGQERNARAPAALKTVLETVQAGLLTGNPGQDWLAVRRLLADSNVTELKLVAELVIYLMAFNRGRRISDSLADAWVRAGTYSGARQIIEAAITEDQIVGSDSGLSGINVMTMHKSKGKEFDGVVILHLGYLSPYCPPQEAAPHTKSRKLLRVAITRARHEVLMLTDAYNPSPLLQGHRL